MSSGSIPATVGPEGVVNILKPPGMTSSNAVADVRRLFRVKRVGHTGTLDPGAAGVLPICLGRATRLFDLLVDKQKEYIAEIAFGACTDTQDSYGRVTKRGDSGIQAQRLIDILPVFTGRQQQTAPAYSALKSGGRALYEIARSGGEVPERVRDVVIEQLVYLHQTAPDRHLFRVRCSRGTYVRTLCEDIGRALGTCAHLSFLLRTASGAFTIEHALSIQELEEMNGEGRLLESVTPVEQVVSWLPRVCVDGEDASRIMHGVTLAYGGSSEVYREKGLCRVYAEDQFLGIGESTEEGLKLKIHFHEA